ncbi:MAG: transposase [Okeania sp. SIO3C4]|nr:transposase [Okeania sp. SIO3C4]
MNTEYFEGKSGRKSTRLPHWNYAQNGWYFITICTSNRENFFGNITQGQMQLSNIGKIAKKFWVEIPLHTKQGVYLDRYVIMPNHLHGVLIIDNSTKESKSTEVKCNVSTEYDLSRIMSEISPKEGSLSAIIRSYKSAVTNWCNSNNYSSFGWQKRFYEKIIRDDKSLENIRKYIINNPIKWENDRNNVVGLLM